jgi:hypothetical protein
MRQYVHLALCAAVALALPAIAAAQQQPSDGARPGNEISTGMSLPRSDKASNLNRETTQSELAPNLPSPPAGDDIQTLLLDARRALKAGQTGEAQEALERAETRALDRSVAYGTERVVDHGPLVTATGEARAALAANDLAGAIRIIDSALPRAAMADIP